MTSLRPPILAAAATLSDLTRCRILRALERHELTVSELCTILQLPQSTVSRHLKVLADLDWLRVRREGTSHLYQQDRLSDSDGRLWGLIRDQLAVGPHAEEDEARLERVLEERRSRTEEFFASTAGQWDLLRDELFGTRFDLLALAGFLGPSWVVADLACGTGRVAEALAPFVGRLIAIDGSRAMLKAARARLGRFDNISVRTGSLEQVPVEDDSHQRFYRVIFR